MQESNQTTPITPELTPPKAEDQSQKAGAEQIEETQTSAETAPSLEEMLREAQLNAAEHHDAWLRAKAETDNVRKRASADLANVRKYALESFASELLTVKDSLEAALAVNEGSLESYRRGVELTLRQLSAVFEKFNITEVNPVNEKFDPQKHQAISTVASEAPANTVVAVMQKGYQLHDRILRPALVVVAKAEERST
jgi:molecular chaperone GrpE